MERKRTCIEKQKKHTVKELVNMSVKAGENNLTYGQLQAVEYAKMVKIQRKW